MNQRLLSNVSVVLAIVMCSGCGDDRFQLAPVSGVITLEDIPLSDARVSFEPIQATDDMLIGPGSFALTDSRGHYALQTIMGDDGAVVGLHQVTIRAFRDTPDMLEMNTDNPARTEIVPAKYNDESTLTFTVTPEGSDTANFALTSAPTPSGQ